MMQGLENLLIPIFIFVFIPVYYFLLIKDYLIIY